MSKMIHLDFEKDIMIKPKKKCLHQKHNLLSRPVRVLLCNLTVSDLFEKKMHKIQKNKALTFSQFNID